MHITRNSMQLATGSDLTTSRLGQPHEGVIGAKVSKRVAYCSAAQDLLSGTEIFFGGALRVLTRFSRKSHPRRTGPPPPPTSNRCRTPVARAHRAGRQNVRSWPRKFSFYITDVLVFDSEARPLAGLRVEFSQAHLLLGA